MKVGALLNLSGKQGKVYFDWKVKVIANRCNRSELIWSVILTEDNETFLTQQVKGNYWKCFSFLRGNS